MELSWYELISNWSLESARCIAWLGFIGRYSSSLWVDILVFERRLGGILDSKFSFLSLELFASSDLLSDASR